MIHERMYVSTNTHISLLAVKSVHVRVYRMYSGLYCHQIHVHITHMCVYITCTHYTCVYIIIVYISLQEIEWGIYILSSNTCTCTHYTCVYTCLCIHTCICVYLTSLRYVYLLEQFFPPNAPPPSVAMETNCHDNKCV